MMGYTPGVDTVTAGMNLLTIVLQLIQKALAGDRGAQERLRRVEEVLIDSPTEAAWANALEKAKRKPLAVPIGVFPTDSGDQ